MARTWPNQSLRSMPGCAFLFFLAQRPGAPELRFSASICLATVKTIFGLALLVCGLVSGSAQGIFPQFSVHPTGG